VIFYLEVKYDSALGMHHSLVAALNKAGDAARSIVISFDQSTLAALRQVDTALMMGLLVEEPGLDQPKTAIELGVRQLCPRADFITTDLVDAAHRLDLQVATWTVDEPAQIRSVVAAGVDGIISNFPDRVQAILEDMH
jgi:glycerophosphoryl diester phosphodiesterase